MWPVRELPAAMLAADSRRRNITPDLVAWWLRQRNPSHAAFLWSILRAAIDARLAQIQRTLAEVQEFRCTSGPPQSPGTKGLHRATVLVPEVEVNGAHRA